MERRAFLAIPKPPDISGLAWTPEDVATYKRLMAEYAEQYVGAMRLYDIDRARACREFLINGPS